MDRYVRAGALRRRWGIRVTLALVLGLAILPAGASGRVDPGEQPELAPDEGLLVVVIDSDVPLGRIRFQKVGSNWKGGGIRAAEKGRTTELHVLPAGRYQWSRITVFDTWAWTGSFDLTGRGEFAFEVKAGQINYAGDLVYRSTGFLDADIRLSNRALPVLDWLQAQHPTPSTRLPFAYGGHYPDPFPDFYREVMARASVLSAAGLDAGREAPAPGALPLAPRLLWKPSEVEDVALSPDGQLVAIVLREEKENRWALNLVDVDSGVMQRLAISEMPFRDSVWESERILLATHDASGGLRLHAFHIDEPVGGKRAARHVVVPRVGQLVDLLREEPGTVLYAARDRKDKLFVHRLRLDDEDSVSLFSRTNIRDRLNVGVENDLGWFADGHGRLRAALARKGEEDIVLLHGQDGVFREVMRYQANSGFQPMQLSYDGSLFYGFTEDGRGQRDLVEFDPGAGKVTRTLYSKPGVDLVSAIFDHRRVPIGASYYQEGRLVTDYFDEANRRLDRLLREAFPGRTVATAQRSRDAGRMLLWVDGSDQPPQLYLLDVAQGRAELFVQHSPELAGREFARAQVLKVHSSDGLPVEAFLTLPAGKGKRPLVVMPHGGPIGVSDDLHFNREVQFLASLGYAVLQVNFRGSEGYGKAFREAGHRNYGKLIEDDIDAAIRAAVASYPLDESRMCALGSSYGGYSAMVSAIRWPQRFRCAVSIAGVSDRALFFTASDIGGDAETRERMELLMGDPSLAADLAEMQATSPLYRYRDLQVPLMLVHGGEDARVDYEHTRRLVRMLNLAGRTPVLMTFPDEGHGLEKLESLERAWTAIAGFLGQYLGPPAASAAAAVERSPAPDNAGPISATGS